jgi:predicted rRNA methylase YqxC with S4 and FtsJ domains
MKAGHGPAMRFRAARSLVAGKLADDQSGALVSPTAAIDIADPAQAYVSRAALKLKAGLDAFGFDPAGPGGA